MLPQGQGQRQGHGQIRFMMPQWREEFVNFYFERIQEFHDCYVKNFFPPDNMRKVLIGGKDLAGVNQL